MEEHYTLLEKLIDHELTHTFLRYNTNLTRLQLKKWDVIALWKYFDRVEVAVSVDGIEEDCSKIRRGLKWNPFLENCAAVAAMPNIHFKNSTNRKCA